MSRDNPQLAQPSQHSAPPARPGVLARIVNGFLGLEHVLTVSVHSLAALLLLIAAGLTFYQVMTRYLFGQPLTWAEAATRSLMIWSVYLGSAAAFRAGSMIAVEVLYRVLPRRLLVPAYTLVAVLCVGFFGLLAFYGYKMTLRVQAQTLASLPLSIAWVYAALPVGSLFGIVAIVARYVAVLRDPEKHLLFSETVEAV